MNNLQKIWQHEITRASQTKFLDIDRIFITFAIIVFNFRKYEYIEIVWYPVGLIYFILQCVISNKRTWKK